MKLRLERGLLFTTVSIEHQQRQLNLEQVLVDTGSAGSIFQTEQLEQLGINYELTDEMHRIRGVGGAEFVFTKQLEILHVGHLQTQDFQIEVGWMDYGFEIHGILGLDFLRATKAIIDLQTLELR
jgi:hypothetical protein